MTQAILYLLFPKESPAKFTRKKMIFFHPSHSAGCMLLPTLVPSAMEGWRAASPSWTELVDGEEEEMVE